MFYLGTHQAHWLRLVDVPLFVSRTRLENRKTLPQAEGRWALDSGGFTELRQRGGWSLPTADYISQVRRYADEIGNLDWAAPQDWMCEPSMMANTGLTIHEHQQRTVDNFLDLRQELGTLVIPVLQGWDLGDYLRCAELYDRAGVDLLDEPTVGLGSVCRRYADQEIGTIIASLQPIRIHAFGVKGKAYRANHDLLASADSMAWTNHALHNPPLPGHTHKSCSSCLDFALMWRKRLLSRLGQDRLFVPPPNAGGVLSVLGRASSDR